MNDVTEPYVVNRDLGGVGIDYHEVMQSSNLVARYLVNETGYGRLFTEIFESHSMSKELRPDVEPAQMANIWRPIHQMTPRNAQGLGYGLIVSGEKFMKVATVESYLHSCS